jgi:hypothetical protein
MGVLDSGLKVGKSIAFGAGIMVIAPIIAPALAGKWKAIAKGAIKGGITAYGIIKASAAGTVDSFKDIAAEAKAELAGPDK